MLTSLVSDLWYNGTMMISGMPGEGDGGLNADAGRRIRSLSDLAIFKNKKNYATSLMNEARKQIYINFISENSLNQRDLFNATRKLLKQENKVLFPPFKERLQLAIEMRDFFCQKDL